MKSNMKSGGQEPTKVQGVMEAESDELRLILVGKTGVGKSAAGNTILGGKHFRSRASSSSVTRVCELASATLQGRTVTVVDLPGFGDTHLSAEQVHEEVARCVCLCAPGPHAFLLVVPIGRYTEEEDRAVTQMTGIFGEAAVRQHTVLLFTRGDDLEGSGIEEYLSTATPGLRALIARCGGRYHVFNNKEPGNSAQVGELLLKVDAMVKENGFYTNDMFEEVAASIREEVERRIRGNALAIPDVFMRVLWEMRSKIPPELLKRVTIMVAAVATGVAVGALIGVGVPLALAGCASAVAAGTVVAVLTGETAVTLGALVGVVVGGAVGVRVGTKASSPEEGAKETVKKVVEIGATAVNTMKESCYQPLSKQRQE